jgi:hypothetical protein
MKTPKENLQDYQKNLTQDQSAELLLKMAWCNSCDALDIFCTKNNMGYCRECFKQVTEPSPLRKALYNAQNDIRINF